MVGNHIVRIVGGWSDSGLCPLPDFCISGAKTSVSATTKLLIRWMVDK